MNSHIHLLESMTAYNEVVGTHAPQLKELFEIVRDKICVKPGCMHLYFNPDWTPVPDLDSFGHDIETAYLLVEAGEELKLHNDPASEHMSRALVDHSLGFGWDKDRGGFYNEGATFRKVFDKEKIWWVQAEGLNALLLMHEKYGKETGKYWNAFLKQWDFIQKNQLDAKNGGWISTVSEDGHSKPGQVKSDQWKECYHQGRAMINVIERLKKMAGK